MKSMRLFLIFWVSVACSADGLIPLLIGDKLRVTVTTTADGSVFTIQTKTTGSYGCDAALSVRTGRNANTIFCDFQGVQEGTDGCAVIAANSRTEIFEKITNRVMKIEIRYNGQIERFTLQKDGNNDWSVEAIETVFSTLVVVNS